MRPLALGLCEGSDVKEQVQKRLAQAVVNRDYTIATGFLSTPFVLGELTKMGRADLAYRMLENEKQPGWLYEVKQGSYHHLGELGRAARATTTILRERSVSGFLTRWQASCRTEKIILSSGRFRAAI